MNDPSYEKQSILPTPQDGPSIETLRETTLQPDDREQKATFVVRVQCQQNSTWQGTVTWVDAKAQQNFRSALELLGLMDSALGGKGLSLPRSDWEKPSPEPES